MEFNFENTDDVIIVTSLLFSPQGFYHNLPVINSIGTRKKTNKLNKLMLPL